MGGELNVCRRIAGLTLLEILMVVAALGTMFAVAVPVLIRGRARADVAAARDAFASSLGLARQVAAQYGRVCRLHLDPVENRFWVTADTSTTSVVSALDTVQPIVDVGDRFGGVRVDARARVFCFDPRGLATARSGCDLPNATVIFRRGGVADTLTISRQGRVLRR